MTRTLKIDFVSDVVCPWCVVGLGGLEGALARLKGEGIEADITFQPFELNPQMVLADAAAAAGLDRGQALEVLAEGRYAEAVRADETLWTSRGISSVPAVVIDGQYLISGGQSVEVFEQALRNIINGTVAGAPPSPE